MRYVVVVQDFGEIYRYAHSTREEAELFMREECLPCYMETEDEQIPVSCRHE